MFRDVIKTASKYTQNPCLNILEKTLLLDFILTRFETNKFYFNLVRHVLRPMSGNVPGGLEYLIINYSCVDDSLLPHG